MTTNANGDTHTRHRYRQIIWCKTSIQLIQCVVSIKYALHVQVSLIYIVVNICRAMLRNLHKHHSTQTPMYTNHIIRYRHKGVPRNQLLFELWTEGWNFNEWKKSRDSQMPSQIINNSCSSIFKQVYLTLDRKNCWCVMGDNYQVNHTHYSKINRQVKTITAQNSVIENNLLNIIH